DPDDVVHNLFAAQAWGDSPLGRPIAGTVESIAALTRPQITDFYRQHYRPAAMVVTVAGNVDHEAVVAAVSASFGRNQFLTGDESPVRAHVTSTALEVNPGVQHAKRPLEQINLVVGMQGLTRNDPRR